MTAMSGTPYGTRRRTRALGCIFAIALIAGCGAGDARADDDEAFDTKFIKGMLRGFGLRDGTEPQINYRERSPLVVPPSRDLPPPESGAAPRDPAWPVDADERKRRARAVDRNKPLRTMEESARVLRPDELELGKIAPRPEGKPMPTEIESARPLSPSQLGSKGLINLFRSDEEKSTFISEPPRNTLVQPPAGYRTPSPDQPYGIGTKATRPKPVTIEERAAGIPR
jgi:hypothetical protein